MNYPLHCLWMLTRPGQTQRLTWNIKEGAQGLEPLFGAPCAPRGLKWGIHLPSRPPQVLLFLFMGGGSELGAHACAPHSGARGAPCDVRVASFF